MGILPGSNMTDTLDMAAQMLKCLPLIAIAAYLLGCINGALIVSELFYREDVRSRGSGNAGLTNFYRNYGAHRALIVIAVDMGKAAASILIARAVISDAWFAALFAGLFCIVGHMFPVTAKFHGGKGILCGATLMLFLDWRVALVGWGIFALLWLSTRYVSLGSVTAAISFPVMVQLVHGEIVCTLIAAPAALLIVWAHRGNIKRLLNGTENKFRFHIHAPSEGEK